jgi:lipopolysaccharide biosynthesis regulator YciM
MAFQEESLVQLKTSGLHQLLPTIKQKFQRLGRLHRPEELLKVAKTAAANGSPMLIFRLNMSLHAIIDIAKKLVKIEKKSQEVNISIFHPTATNPQHVIGFLYSSMIVV